MRNRLLATGVATALAVGGCGGPSPEKPAKSAAPRHEARIPLGFPSQPEALKLLGKVPVGNVVYEYGGRVEHQRPLKSTTTLAGAIELCASPNQLDTTTIWQQETPWGIDTTMHYQTVRRHVGQLCAGNGQITSQSWQKYLEAWPQPPTLGTPQTPA